MAPLTQASGPQLHLERWMNLLATADLSQVVDFIRDTEEIRSHEATIQSVNTVFATMGTIIRDGDLTEGTIKTLPEPRRLFLAECPVRQ